MLTSLINNYHTNNFSDHLTKLIKEDTCFKSQKGSLIDILLINIPKGFQKTKTFVTGINDYQKFVVTF